MAKHMSTTAPINSNLDHNRKKNGIVVAFIAIVAILALVAGITACSQGKSASAGGDKVAAPAQTETEAAPAQAETAEVEVAEVVTKPTFAVGVVYAANSTEVKQANHLLPKVDEDAILGVFAGTRLEVKEYVWAEHNGEQGFIPVIPLPQEQGIDALAPTRIKNKAGLKYPDTLNVWGSSLMEESRILEIRAAGQAVDLTHDEKLDNITRLADPLWSMAVNIAGVKAGVFTSFPSDIAKMYMEGVPYSLKGWEDYSLTLADGRTINGVVELKALAAASSLFYSYDTSQALWANWRLVVVGTGSGANRFAYAPEKEYIEEGACVLVRGDLGHVRKVMAALGGTATVDGEDVVCGFNVAGGEFTVMRTCKKSDDTLTVARGSQPATPTPSTPTPSNPTPSNPTPSNPTPTNPTPSNPTPTNPTPSNPTPDTPTPTPVPVNPTPDDNPKKDKSKSSQEQGNAPTYGGVGDGADAYEATPTTKTTTTGDYKPKADEPKSTTAGGSTGTTAPSKQEVESHAGTTTTRDADGSTTTTTTTVNPGNGGNTPDSVTTDVTSTTTDTSGHSTTETTWGAEAGGSVKEAPASTGAISDSTGGSSASSGSSSSSASSGSSTSGGTLADEPAGGSLAMPD